MAPVDLARLIDEQPVGRRQVGLLVFCAAVLFVDGFDTQAIGYVAPEIARVWHLPRGALGPVFSASLVGLMLGALLMGPLADRFGRKWIIVASTVVFGACTLATLLAADTTGLLIIRFLTGLGLGGAMPNAVALTAEYSPHRRRATMVMTMFAGFSVGAALGGLIAAALIPAYGWQSVFLIGGVAPLLLAPALALRLPESARYLAATGRGGGRLLGIVQSMFPSQVLPPGTRFVSNDPVAAGNPLARLFADGRSPATLLLWVIFFMSLLDLYFLSNWLPTLLNELGASVSVAAVIGAMLQVGGIVGVVGLGRLVDRFSFRALAVTYGLAAFAVAAISVSGHSIALVTAAIFCAGFCIVGGQTACNALAATYYPTAIRATGVGWALGVGRVGSIVGPLIGGALLALRWDPASLFLAAALPAACAAVAAVALTAATAKRDRSVPARLREGVGEG